MNHKALSHSTLYGAVVSLASNTPSTKKSTRVTPWLSVASAWMETRSTRTAPLAGEVMATVGAALSTVTLTSVEVATLL